MRAERVLVAIVLASLACGGGEVAADRPSEPQSPEPQAADLVEVVVDEGGTKLPASWPTGVPDYGAPLFAADVPGAVAGKNDLTVTWQVPETMQQVADRYIALESQGWKRGFMMSDATMFGGSWSSPDGKTSLMVSATPDATVAGTTAVSATVNYLP